MINDDLGADNKGLEAQFWGKNYLFMKHQMLVQKLQG